MAGLTDRIVMAESGGDPFARNSRSSAAGSAQFLSGTWLEMLQKHKPELVRGKTKEQLLAMRDDPALSREMTGLYDHAPRGHKGRSIVDDVFSCSAPHRCSTRRHHCDLRERRARAP